MPETRKVETISTADIMLAEGLGKYPYVLLRLLPDPEDPSEPQLTMTAGNGPEEHPNELPLMFLMLQPAEGNPVAEMLRDQWRAVRTDGSQGAVEAITREFNPEWLPFVTGEAANA